MSDARMMPNFSGPELSAPKAVGVGPEVTAGGVFADLLRLASYLGGSPF